MTNKALNPAALLAFCVSKLFCCRRTACSIRLDSRGPVPPTRGESGTRAVHASHVRGKPCGLAVVSRAKRLAAGAARAGRCGIVRRGGH